MAMTGARRPGGWPTMNRRQRRTVNIVREAPDCLKSAESGWAAVAMGLFWLSLDEQISILGHYVLPNAILAPWL